MLLTYLGACHPEAPYVVVRKVSRFIVVFLLCLFKGLWVVPYSGGFPKIGANN